MVGSKQNDRSKVRHLPHSFRRLRVTLKRGKWRVRWQGLLILMNQRKQYLIVVGVRQQLKSLAGM